MKNSKSKPGNRKSWKNIYEIFSSVPAMFDFVQDSTNELERRYFKKQDIKWIVKNTFISFAGTGILSAMFISCEKGEPVAPGFSISDRQEKASAVKAGQSVMIAVDVPDLIIEGSAVWQFDKLAASVADFEWNTCATQLCRQQAESDARAARCEYWNMAGHPYWVLIGSNSGGKAAFMVNTLFAGESFRLGGGKKSGKYSFSMRTPNGESRLANLTYSLDGGPPIPIGHAVVDGSGSNNCFLDLVYSANNGPYGNPGAYPYLKTGETIGAIFASDDAPGNDAGCPNVSVAAVDPISLTLGPGDHTIIISANLVGADGLENILLSQVKNFKISAAGCRL